MSAVEKLTTDAADRLDSLYRAYGAYVLRYVRARVSDQALAEDLAADVWVTVAGSLSGLQDDHALSGLLALLARQSISSWYRRPRAGELPADLGPGSALERRAVAPSAEEEAMPDPEPGLSGRCAVAVASLPERQRRVITLYCDGLSHRSIAAREGCAHATAARNLRAAVSALRGVLTA